LLGGLVIATMLHAGHGRPIGRPSIAPVALQEVMHVPCARRRAGVAAGRIASMSFVQQLS
jgi:hypothetical protein